ncbi:DMT family transporter [Pararhizobium sp.]|uniref:DMT family transporter n=1 Tax=Pararhizobium sp. TaxID=1977563 RepID=UPI00271CEC51|nr:DMT family transporter [Pararhizobium sp.]MDO9418559.1 DMT family transporter [Pararhizobium sp.]
MAALLWSLLGIVAGACIAIQAPINTQLGRSLGLPVAAACISFLAGAVVLATVALVMAKVEGKMPDWRAPAHWLYFAGGALGTVYVTTAILLTPRIGAAAVMGLAVAGQLIAGLMIDRIGFLGVTVREISAGRIAGAAMLLAGVVMIRTF